MTHPWLSSFLGRFGCLIGALALVISISTHGQEIPTPVATFIQNMATQQGLLGLHYSQADGKVYLSVPKQGADYIFQTSLPRGLGSNDIGLDRGQLGDTRLVSFERYGNKLMLTEKNTRYRATADNPAEQRSVKEAFAQSILAGFIIEAENDAVMVIDYTGYLLSDVHGIQQRLSRNKQGNFSVDRSRSAVYANRTKSFVNNTELEAVITFAGNAPGNFVRQVAPDPTSISIHLHHSFIALPEAGYTARAFHPMSGFWERSYQDYSTAITENMEQQFIVRHRLHKKDPGAAVSEAVEPIVYYLDPGIPEPVLSALKEGAQWWDQAFAAAGYNNAFQVKVLPEDADPMDVRYNVIQWVHRATRGWSYGTSVVDPRTGELLKGHVTLGSLRVRQDYLIALGLTSPFDKPDADTSKQAQMALNRIKQLSAHEVGHTLGIAHNFAASESGRASVMDYPHPKIDIFNGRLSLANAYATGIGEWDKLVVEYGYQDYTSGADEARGLIQTIEKMRNSGIAYKSDPDSRSGRYATADGHLWDNGSDPITEFDHLSQVRSIALNNFGINTLAEGDNLSSLAHRLAPVYLLHRYQLNAIAKQVGGIEYAYEQKIRGMTPKGVKAIEAKRQRQALARLLKASTSEYLALPEHIAPLIPPLAYGDQPNREDFASRIGRVFDPITAAEAAAFTSLNLLLDPQRLARLNYQHSQNYAIPSVQQVVMQVLNTHWMVSELSMAPLQDRLRHVALQVIFNVMADEETAPEVTEAMLSALVEFEMWMRDDAEKAGYPKPMVTVMLRQLDAYWKTGIWPVKYRPQPMPPGSPI